MLAFIVDAYDTEEVEGRQRTVLRLHPRIAPVKVAVLPLVSKEGMPERARGRSSSRSAAGSRPSSTRAARSASATAARTRSARPWGVTVDGQTLEDDTVTLRDRDSLEQVRVPVDGLADALEVRLTEPWRSPKLSELRPGRPGTG